MLELLNHHQDLDRGAEVTHHLTPFSKEHYPYGGKIQNSLKRIEITLYRPPPLQFLPLAVSFCLSYGGCLSPSG